MLVVGETTSAATMPAATAGVMFRLKNERSAFSICSAQCRSWFMRVTCEAHIYTEYYHVGALCG